MEHFNDYKELINEIRWIKERFGDDVEVWRWSDGSYVVGDAHQWWVPDHEDVEYTQIGTVADLLTIHRAS